MSKSRSTKRKRGYRRGFDKQLREHNYATTLPLFQPTNYEIVFINRTTSIEKLTELNQRINQTKTFMMDTESINEKFQPNIPTIIQLQMCFETMSMILIVETHHLPEKNQPEFNLIRKLFSSLLKRDNRIFVWGDINELTPFICFELFDQQQILRSNHRNIQDEFKEYWERNYPHNPDQTHTCECKKCFGINHDNAIALQDAVAFKLHQYLNKDSSCEAFNIGLDMKLQSSPLTPEDIEYAERLTNYAANDCDAIYQLILASNLINDYYGQYDLLIDDIDHLDEMMIEEQAATFEQTPTTAALEIPTTTNESEQERQTAPDNTQANTTRTTKWENPLPKEERVKIHNRSRSRHQRMNAYKREFTIYNIDERFPVSLMKKILKQHGIPLTRIHPTQSKYTQETILFVGLTKSISTNKYNEVKHLFNREHYRRVFPNKPNNKSNRNPANSRSTTGNHRQHTHRYNRQEHQRQQKK